MDESQKLLKQCSKSSPRASPGTTVSHLMRLEATGRNARDSPPLPRYIQE